MAPAAVFATGLSNLLNIIGLPLAYGKTMATVIIIVLALTVMQLVLRFMKVATIELVGDHAPIMRNGPVATFIAAALTLLLSPDRLVAIPVDPVRRRQPVASLPGPAGCFPVAPVPGQKGHLHPHPHVVYVHHHHRRLDLHLL